MLTTIHCSRLPQFSLPPGFRNGKFGLACGISREAGSNVTAGAGIDNGPEAWAVLASGFKWHIIQSAGLLASVTCC